MAIDFTKYGTPIQQTKSTGVDFSKYGTPVQMEEQPEEPGFFKGVARDIIKPFARAGTNIVQAGQIALGKEKTQPFSGDFLGEVKPVGQEGTFGERLKETTGVGLQIASNIPITRGAGLTYQGIKQGFKAGAKEGLKTLAPLAREGAFGGGTYMTGQALEEQKSLPEALKQGVTGTLTGAVAGPLIGAPLITAGAATKGLINLMPEKITGINKIQRLQPEINKQVDELMVKTKGIIGKQQLAQRKNVDVQSYLKDPVVFKGLKVEGSKINPDEALQTIVNRTDTLMDAKSKLLPEVDRLMPKTSKEVIRQKAINEVRGQYAPLDEEDIINAINRQVDALPDELNASQIDSLRARFRKSARDAKGLQKRGSEYTALENATRDTVFDITDNLPFDTNKEYQAINNAIKDLIEVQTFLDKTIRGQIVKGGRLTNALARTTGAIAGSKFGIFGALAGSEIGGVMSDILVNNQFGSAFKMRLLKNITDDPAIIKVAQEFLEKAQKYNPLDTPSLPAGAIPMPAPSRPQGGAQILPAQKNPVSVNPQTGKFQTTYSSSPQRSQGIETMPKARSSIQPITSNAPKKPIAPIIPRKSLKGKGETPTTKQGIFSKLKGKAQDIIDNPKLGLSAQDVSSGSSKLGQRIVAEGTQKPTLKLKRDVQVTTLSGEKTMIPEDEVLKAYESGGKALLKDGREYIVSKSQYENIKNNSLKSEAKEFAPELKGTEETIKGRPSFDELKRMKARGEITEAQRAEMLSGDNTKYSSYQLPEGKNYKEILIKAPIKKSFKGETASQSMQRIRGDFQSSHWDEPNVIAHLRLNERTYKGKKVTFMEELQSDWAREGRSKGFLSDVKNYSEAEYKSLSEKIDKVTKKYQQGSRDPITVALEKGELTQNEVNRMADLNNVHFGTSNRVPNNPLLKNWQELSVKRALKEAVDNNSEYLAWTTGEQQAARYNLAKEIDNIKWENIDANTGKAGKDYKIVLIYPKNGASFIEVRVLPNGIIKDASQSAGGSWTGKKLDEVIGKGLAEKIVAQEKGELSGEGLNFGGEWAKNLYDKQVKNIVEDLTGKKVEVIDMGLTIDKGVYTNQFLDTTKTGNSAIIKPEDLKIGKTIDRAQPNPDGTLSTEGEQFIITDILGDGKFKAVPKENNRFPSNIWNEFIEQKSPEVNQYAEIFDISTKKSTGQQAIKITPEIRALVKGETPKLSKINMLPKGKKGILEKLKNIPNKEAGIIQMYNGEKDLTTKILKDLEGKTTVSKQYILDATNRGELKQVERDLIRDIVSREGDTVNVSDFAKKVKAELLPLKSSDYVGQYEGVTLPSELRGNIKDYTERVYQSPIKTSAGDVHFGSRYDDLPNEAKGTPKNYFGHTRIEDMADNKTRRVIEVQSDLYQKGNLEKEGKMGGEFSEFNRLVEKKNYFEDQIANPSSIELKENPNYIKETQKELDIVNQNLKKYEAEYKARQSEVAKLQQYNDPTAHFRMIREEIKKASQDGKTKLQFPTGETAMKIEGLGNVDTFSVKFETPQGIPAYKQATPENLKIGQEIKDSSRSEWIITDVLGDGKFKAVPKDTIDALKGQPQNTVDAFMRGHEETFDISGKVDTNNPIYKFYEKDVQKYLNKFGGKKVVDDKGVSWIEVPIKKEWAKMPVEAFGKAMLSPLFIGAGISTAAVIGNKVYNKKKALPKEKPIFINNLGGMK